MTGEVLIVSCYELGRPPTGAASPLAWLRRAGIPAAGVDLAVGPLNTEQIKKAPLVGISTPMHTALALGVKTAARVRAANPEAKICFFGLYAQLNAEFLLAGPADFTIGGEFEDALTALAADLAAGGTGRIPGVSRPGRLAAPIRKRLDHPVPLRSEFGPLEGYASLVSAGTTTPAGFVEASRGCKHLCLHCPVVPVYAGRFFAVPVETVLEDARRQIAAGARHLSFGDPDFLNGPGHALRVVRALRKKFPGITFDFTAKVEHIVKHEDLWPELAEAGCLFVVSAVESLSGEVLRRLNKGHTRADAFQALKLLRGCGIALRPSLVSFTPWTTLADYLEVLDWVEREWLHDNFEPVHFAIRLLLPPGSPLAEDPAMKPHLTGFDPKAFGHSWKHPDPRMDALQAAVMNIVEKGSCAGEDNAAVISRVHEHARALAEGRAPVERPRPPSKSPAPPRLSETWFCCAEPTGAQLSSV